MAEEGQMNSFYQEKFLVPEIARNVEIYTNKAQRQSRYSFSFLFFRVELSMVEQRLDDFVNQNQAPKVWWLSGRFGSLHPHRLQPFKIKFNHKRAVQLRSLRLPVRDTRKFEKHCYKEWYFLVLLQYIGALVAAWLVMVPNTNCRYYNYYYYHYYYCLLLLYGLFAVLWCVITYVIGCDFLLYGMLDLCFTNNGIIFAEVLCNLPIVSTCM